MSQSVSPDQTVAPFAIVNKIFYGMVMLAIATMVLSFIGTQLGKRIALGGHSSSTHPHEIVIDRTVLNVPENYIRFQDQRRDGIMDQLELYALWPSMEGYSSARADAFNSRLDSQNLVFLSVVPQQMSKDMSGRFEPIYSNLVNTDTPQISEHGLVGLPFKEAASVFKNEIMWTSQTAEPFVARCLSSMSATSNSDHDDLRHESIAGCIRDMHLPSGLSVRYRFSNTLLQDWRTLDASVLALMDTIVKD